MLERNFSKGMRKGIHQLTDEEVLLVENEILRLKIDKAYIEIDRTGKYKTHYDEFEDKVIIGYDIIPDDEYPDQKRDILSIGAVLAHEYYGHRPFRDKYIKDFNEGIFTYGFWEDEYNASYFAARNAPNLTKEERQMLVEDALDRKREANIEVVYDDFIRKILEISDK